VRREIVASRLPSSEWPEPPLLITAVDAADGAFVIFDRTSGVSLVDAVAASCAVPGIWPPVTIGGRRYVDGGVRSVTNAYLAGGHDRVLVLSPLPSEQTPAAKREVANLCEGGSDAVLLEADEAALAAMGPNPLDPGRRSVAVAEGRRQGAAWLEDVRRLWSGWTSTR